MCFCNSLLTTFFVLWFRFFFLQAEDGIRDRNVTGVQTCALPIFAGAVPVLAKGAARVDDGVVDRGVEVIAGRVRRLGQLARLPQTGAVHQYLLQAVVVLTVGAVIWSVYRGLG